MPDNKQMKIQWITINGRQVPLVLPQTYSYADDDWKVTSDRDPLPIVEYGTTEGGVIVPKRVSDEGHELTQLTGSNAENVELIAGAQDMFVPTGTSLQVIDLVKVSEYNFFFVQMIPVGGDEYRVTFRPTRGDTSGSLMEYEILKVSSSASNQTSKRFEVNGLKLSFYLENQMDIDHTFRSLYVFGVRA